MELTTRQQRCFAYCVLSILVYLLCTSTGESLLITWHLKEVSCGLNNVSVECLGVFSIIDSTPTSSIISIGFNDIAISVLHKQVTEEIVPLLQESSAFFV